jgi:hypothetical protein
MTLFKKAKPIDAMKHFALFLLALILSGVMALSHVSAGSTAPSDIGITRVTELKAAEIDGIRFESIRPEPVLTLPKKQPDTNGVIALGHVPRLLAGAVDAEQGRATELASFESTHSNIDSNAVERNGIRWEILVPDRVWRIPEKQDATTPVRIGFQMTNNTPHPRFPPLDTLLVFPLEIVDADGNLLRGSGGRGMLLQSPQLPCPLVQPRESLTFFLKAELFWQNNQLLFGGNDGLGGGWSFDNLKPGNYQIRLRYINSRAFLVCYDPDRDDENLTRGIWTGQIVTPFVKFRVLQSESK